MPLAVTYCRSSRGVDAPPVCVEAHLANGLPRFNMVGLPETAVKESKERVRSALVNSQFRFPGRRITVNLAPADIPKSGGRFDLAIAIAILAASEQLHDVELHCYEFVGELGLTGTVRPVSGALPAAIAAKKAGRALFINHANAFEASLVDELTIYAVDHLLQVSAHLTGQRLITPYQRPAQPASCEPGSNLCDVRGQKHARRALEIAAAGRHSMLMIGPPGTGKTLLSQCLPGISPDLSKEQALESAAIQSICGITINTTTWKQQPFRAPHHSLSSIALVGGSSPPRPGEISRAHNGVLFLDELPEFNRKALEALREPLESGEIYISRAKFQTKFPANFQLLAAMNPCPCGYLNSKQRPCECTPDQIKRYQSKVSGPLMDRIDLHVSVPPLPKGALSEKSSAESSQEVKIRVTRSQRRQLKRQQRLNSDIPDNALNVYCKLTNKELTLLEQATERLRLSARSHQNILRVARTIADLANSETVSTIHLSEALSYRCLDKCTQE